MWVLLLPGTSWIAAVKPKQGIILYFAATCRRASNRQGWSTKFKVQSAFLPCSTSCHFKYVQKLLVFWSASANFLCHFWHMYFNCSVFIKHRIKKIVFTIQSKNGLPVLAKCFIYNHPSLCYSWNKNADLLFKFSVSLVQDLSLCLIFSPF